MPAYAALLRGINLGGRRLKMNELRRAFTDWGFTEPQSLLASGNVVFLSEESDPAKVKFTIEAGIHSTFGFPSTAILRSADQIASLVSARPTQGLNITKDTNLHVTFLQDPISAEIELPFKSSDPDFEVRKLDDQHLFNIVTLGPKTGSVDLMDWLGSHFDDSATTRTWNTVLKIHSRLQE